MRADTLERMRPAATLGEAVRVTQDSGLVTINCGRAKKKREIMRAETIVIDPRSTAVSHLGRERRAITPMKRLSTVVGV